MKKFGVILVTIFVLFSFAGCNANSKKPAQSGNLSNVVSNSAANNGEGGLQPEKDAKLVIWEDGDKQIEFMKYVAGKFKEKYGVEVEIENVFGGDLFNRLVQDAPSGMGPDIFEGPHDNLGNLIAAGLIQENNNTVDEIKNNLIKSAADCVTYEGKLYAYPVSLSTYALIYNKDIVSKPAETFQEIIDFAKTYNNPKENKYALMWQVNSSYLSHCFLAGYGAYVFGNNGSDKNDIGLNTPDAIEGAKFFRSLKDIFNVKSADADSQMIDGLFTSGKVAYTISGLWSVTTYKKAGVNVGVATLPTLPNGKHPLSYLGVQAVCISSYSQYPNAAKLFAAMATSEEMQLKRYELTGQIPVVKSLVDSEIIKSDPVNAIFLQQAQYSTVMPFIPQMAVVWDPYKRALQTIWDNDVEPKTAMDECVDSIKKFIAAQK